ncbi:hypothetical protein C8R43DRAFT_1130902 [Mycena crocata]|nr:hypothetical protein C8R43DRAFT_1130902 [Mycena crocata]
MEVVRQRESMGQDAGNNKYRIVLVSPETATSSKFHELVLVNTKSFSENIICLNIDEGHCISEWGNDDFQPEYSKLHILLARMPSGLPVVVASATMPRDVILDILAKLRLRADCARVLASPTACDRLSSKFPAGVCGWLEPN